MKVRFFGRLRALADGGELELNLPAAVATTEALRQWLGREHAALLDGKVRIALDDRLALGDEAIGPAQEVAFLPPVSGG